MLEKEPAMTDVPTEKPRTPAAKIVPVVTCILTFLWFLKTHDLEALLAVFVAVMMCLRLFEWGKRHKPELLVTGGIGIICIVIGGVLAGRADPSAVDVRGEWRGTLTESSGDQFDYHIVLSQDRKNIGGRSETRYTRESLSKYFMRTNLKGTIEGNVLKFEETDFMVNVPEPGGIWCLASVELHHKRGKDSEYLEGVYFDRNTTPGCGLSGRIAVKKQR